MLNGFFYLHSLKRSISVRRNVWLVLLLSCFIANPLFNANSVDSGHTSHSAASDLGLHCLQMSLLWDAWHRWVKLTMTFTGNCLYMGPACTFKAISYQKLSFYSLHIIVHKCFIPRKKKPGDIVFGFPWFRNAWFRMVMVWRCVCALGKILNIRFRLFSVFVITCRPSSVRRAFTPFSIVTPGPIFFKLHVESSVKAGLKIYSNGHGPLIQVAPCSYMLKTIKNLLLQNQESFKAKSRYIASWTQGLPQVCSNDDPRLTFDLFTARSNLSPHAYV